MSKYYRCDRCRKDVGYPWPLEISYRGTTLGNTVELGGVRWIKKLDLCNECNEAALEFFEIEIPKEAAT